MDVSTTVGLVMPGMVFDYAGSTAPSGFLLCYGQAISRTTYADLFSIVSTTYGVGDGSTTFNVPDLRGRIAAGKDDMGGAAASRLTSTTLTASNTLGATGGAQTVTIAEAQLPSHTHTLSNHTHTGTTGTESNDHTHTSPGKVSATAGNSSARMIANTATTDGTTGASNGRSATHTHTFTSDGPSTNTSGSTGSGSAVDKTQPTLILNKIIKY